MSIYMGGYLVTSGFPQELVRFSTVFMFSGVGTFDFRLFFELLKRLPKSLFTKDW